MASPLVSVVVKSYQRPWLLGICLQSIEASFGPRGSSYEVVVADDGTEPHLWEEVRRRYGHLADRWIHSVPGESKWNLCRQDRLKEVVPSCGTTWNEAHEACSGRVIFLIEDDSYLTRPVDVAACSEVLGACPEALCLIGLQERYYMEVHGTRDQDRVGRASRVEVRGEGFSLLHHNIWPWSFDGIFYRTSDWAQIGQWPTNAATGPMEGFIQTRLHELGWRRSRPYGLATVPFCRFDSQTSCRTDHPSTYRGRFRHVDACNTEWLTGAFTPTYEDVRLGRASWIRPGATFEPMQLHYPPSLAREVFDG